MRIQVAPKLPRIKVIGVITPIENHVAICKNKVRENKIAALAVKRRASFWFLSVKTRLETVVNKLTGTSKAQIVMQFCRENWEIVSTLSTIVY